ncbi:hypothetical protein [Dethiobacter alkaliphilus]|nr:hypothetical protein [Dethiobacter alkaliphilus]MCW3490058.1 hypothetical protein [Dethiobacter alkaliphilus]
MDSRETLWLIGMWIYPLIYLLFLGLGGYTLILAIKALRIYIKNNSED